MKKGIFLFLGLLFLVSCNEDVTGGKPYTQDQIMYKSIACDKNGMSIQMVYDDQWQVYAVKCIERNKLPNGKEKENE